MQEGVIFMEYSQTMGFRKLARVTVMKQRNVAMHAAGDPPGV